MHHNWRGLKLGNINFLQNQQSVGQGWKRLVLTLHRGRRCERAHGRQSIDCQREPHMRHTSKESSGKVKTNEEHDLFVLYC